MSDALRIPAAPRRPWRALVGRLWPSGLTGQFVVLLVVALVAANAVALVVLSSERDRIVREARRGAVIERFVALAGALSQVPGTQRVALARAMSSPFLKIEVGVEPELGRTASDEFSRGLAREIAAALPDVGLAGRPVHVHIDDRKLRHDAWQSGEWRRIDRVEVSLQLPDGTFVNAFGRRWDGPPKGPDRDVYVPLGLSVLAVLGVGVWFARRLTRPVRALAEAAERAGVGDRGATVPVVGTRELRRAAAAFNTMQAQIARFDAERARTIAAVGHDLRTPITSLRIRAEMLDDEERDAFVRTLDEMRVIADGLLEYGRAGGEAEGRARVDLAALLADLAGGTVRYEGPARLEVSARPVALRRAIGNLVENARRYAGGAVLRLVPADGAAVVTVEDRGPGIPEARLADVMEPFVRLDASRSAATGGAGLGLAIARTLVNAHGGTLSLANRDGGGLLATVRLPLGR